MPSQANTTALSQQPTHRDSRSDELRMDIRAPAQHIHGRSNVLSICQAVNTCKCSNSIWVQTKPVQWTYTLLMYNRAATWSSSFIRLILTLSVIHEKHESSISVILRSWLARKRRISVVSYLSAPLSGQYVSQYEIPWDPLYSKANRKQDKPKQGILVMTFTCIHMQPLKEWCIGLTVAVRGMSGKDIHQCLHSKAKGRQ